MTFSVETLFLKYLPFLASPAGIAIFIFLYAVWVICLLPGSWFSMLAGLIYGSFQGTFIVFLGACLGAQITFFLGRTFLKNWAQKKLSSFTKLKAVETAVTQEGLKLIFLTRLSPLFPFSLLNFVYGISGISFREFTVGLLGILPGTFLYCGLGALAGEISRFDAVLSGRKDVASFVFSIVSLLATLLVVLIVSRKARSVLEEKR